MIVGWIFSTATYRSRICQKTVRSLFHFKTVKGAKRAHSRHLKTFQRAIEPPPLTTLIGKVGNNCRKTYDFKM